MLRHIGFNCTSDSTCFGTVTQCIFKRGNHYSRIAGCAIDVKEDTRIEAGSDIVARARVEDARFNHEVAARNQRVAIMPAKAC